MKKLRVLLAVVAVLTLTIMGCGSSSSSGNAVSITILQTSDIHDHAGGYGSAASYSPLVTGNDTVLGGYARLAAYITGVKNEKGANNVLLCDSGDFTMGTVYTMTIASSPLSFMFFSMMNYDAITLGNHEFDLGPDTLAGIITLAKNNADAPFTIPMLASNMDASGSAAITTFVDDGTIVQSRIVEKAGIKIGLLGIMGPNADFDAPMASPVTFDHTYAALQAQVDALRASGAQTVILLSHEGFTVSGGYAVGNDANIADNVTGIDVILSGHLHINQTAVKTSANPNNTILVEPGAYGEHIARLDVQVDKTTGKVTSYTSINPTIDDTIKGDSTMDYVVSMLVNPALNTALAPAFSGLGLTGVDSILDTVAINNAPITTAEINGALPVGESVLGNLAADSYRNAINGIWASAYASSGGNVTIANAYMAAATGDPNRVQIAFVPGGVIRDPLAVSPLPNISFADLYNVLPLGGDPLDTSALGYPLLTTFIKAEDIYKIVGLSLSLGMDLSHAGASANDTYFINMAGIYVVVGTNNSGANKGFDVYLGPTDLNTSSPNYGMNDNIPTGGPGAVLIDPVNYPNTLYKISVDLYTLMMMYEVGAMLGVTINTYDASGALLPPYGAAGNRVMTGATTTMRAWQAIVGWSWAASGGATSNLSVLPAAGGFGYTSSLPYRRVQLP